VCSLGPLSLAAVQSLRTPSLGCEFSNEVVLCVGCMCVCVCILISRFGGGAQGVERDCVSQTTRALQEHAGTRSHGEPVLRKTPFFHLVF